jgi:hypothetical protein
MPGPNMFVPLEMWPSTEMKRVLIYKLCLFFYKFSDFLKKLTSLNLNYNFILNNIIKIFYTIFIDASCQANHQV